MTIKNKNWKTMADDLEKKMAEIFIKKAPALPEKAKEIIVKYGPYLAIIIMVMMIPAILALIGLGMMAGTLSSLGGVGYGWSSMTSMIFGIIILVLEIKALTGLFKRQMKAWKLMFYISIISAFSSLLRLEIGSLIIGGIISWYFLFQIRSYYK
jgi:hypothetical protein